VDESLISPLLQDATALVMQVVNLGRAAREKAQIRVRQPLSHLYVRVNTEGERASLMRLGDQVLEELNVKRLEFLPPESDMLLYSVKPKLPALGPRLGKQMPKVLAALRGIDPAAAARALREEGKLTLAIDGQPVELSPEEVEVEASAREGFVAAEDRGYVVALETTLTPELVAEGLARDLTHLVQEARKHAGLAIEDTISLALWTDEELAAVARHYATYIRDETLARDFAVSADISEESPGGSGYTETIPAAKLGGHAVTVRVRKR
jgi:isoleucyl-tRNA synthetase